METLPIDPDDQADEGCMEALVMNRMLEAGVRLENPTPELLAQVHLLARDVREGYRLVVSQKQVPYKGPVKGMIWTDGEPEDGPIGTPVTHYHWQTFPPNGKETK